MHTLASVVVGLFVALSCATSYAKPAAQPAKPAVAVDLESKPAPSRLDVTPLDAKTAAKQATADKKTAAKQATADKKAAAKPAAVPPPVAAKPAAKPGPPQPFTVVVGPLRPLGDGNADPRAARKLLEEAVRTVPGAKLIPEATLTAAAKRAGRKELTCADAECLAGLGELVGAQVILGGELGKLGAGQVLYLRTVDVPLALELRGTTLLLDGDARTQKNHARAAAVRALAPAAYVGSVRLDIEVAGATIYVNGRKLGVSPLAPQPLAVGTHALRVTHEQHRDFVRFIDIRFDEEARLPVPLTPLPVITDEMRAEAKRRTAAAPPPRPWYRKKWYGAAAVGAGAFLGAVIVTGIVVGDGAPWDREVTLGRP